MTVILIGNIGKNTSSLLASLFLVILKYESIFRREKVIQFIFMAILLAIHTASVSSNIIRESPIAEGYQYTLEPESQSLYLDANDLGDRVCNLANSLQSAQQLAIFGPIIFSRAEAIGSGSFGHPEIEVYCKQGASEFVYPYPFLGAHTFRWTKRCALGSSLSDWWSTDAACIRDKNGSINFRKNLGKLPELCVGNPVTTSSGNKFLDETDYMGFDSLLIYKRFYNSKDLVTSWRHSYLRTLHVLTGNDTNFYTSSIIFHHRGNDIWSPEGVDIPANDVLPRVSIVDSDGKSITFEQVGVTWIPSTSDHANTALQLIGNIWRYIKSDDTIEIYNTSGRLLSITNRDGRTQTLSYDVNGRLSTVTDDTGRALNFTYDSSSRIKTLTDPAGGIYQYAYDAAGNLASVTYPDSKIRTYHYNESAYTSGTNLPYALTGITDENGMRFATYSYDTQGRAIATEHAGGVERYSLSYSTDGASTVVTDPLNSQYIHTFQTILGVAKSTGQSQPAGSGCNAASSNISYDVNGNVASRTDFNGNKTCYAYDLTRNLEIGRIEGLSSSNNCPGDIPSYIPTANSSERKTLTTWHANFRIPTSITEAGRETSLIYDTYGNVTQHQIKDTATNATRTWTTSYVYHATIPGIILQKTEDGPRTDVSDITTTQYYPPDAACTGGHFGCRAQIASITNALGHTTQITRYNAHSQPEEIIDPNSLTTVLTYDTRQRLLSRTTGTEFTRYQYDNAGQLKKITFPDSSFLSYTYDTAHRLTAIADNAGNRIQYTLDAMGNRIQEKRFDAANNLAKTQQREYDALNRLWKDIGAQNQTTQYQYDAQGNLKQMADPLQHAVNFQFDTRNRLKAIVDPTNGLTQQKQDALDQITQLTDPRSIATTYTYNGLGDLLQEVSADRGTTTYTYDAAGNLKTVIDARGTKHVYTWDALNRPTKRTHATAAGTAAAATLNWGYDAGANGIGHMTSMTDGSGSTSFSYDPHGRLLAKTQTTKFTSGGVIVNNYTQTLSYQYDSFGRQSQMTYPSGTQITTSYGAEGRPSEIRVNGNVLLNNITYYPFGEPKRWVWGNGQIYTRNFDLDGQLATHSVGNDTRTLSYDVAGRLINTADTNNPIYNRGYDYDALDRLINQSDNSGFKLWQYDANSNRIAAQFGGTSYAYTLASNSNRLTHVAGPVTKNYTYDAAGYPLSDGTATFTWNVPGKLITTVKNAKTHTYIYNALDQRISKNGPLSPKFFFFYDPAGQLIGEYKDNATTVTPTDDWLIRGETIWLDDIPIAIIKKPTPTSAIQIYYIHADHLNTPRVITNTSNTIIWRWENTHPFGANLPNEDPDGNGQLFEYSLRFPGQYFDKETGLHYNYFRYYEPETGRYLSPDPIGLAAGMNVWGYVGQNPVSFVDPDGLLPDAIVDLGLIAFDIASYAYNKVRGCDTSEDVASLKANTVGLLIPGATGLGLGIRGVSSTMKNIHGVPVETFSGSIKRRVLRNDTDAYRFSGGVSDSKGRFLTTRHTLKQVNTPKDAERALNLPAGATAETLNKFTIPKGTEIFVGRIKGGAPGATQVFIKDPSILK